MRLIIILSFTFATSFIYGANIADTVLVLRGVKRLPDSMFLNVELRELYCIDCQIDSIPFEISKLRKLKVLDFRGCMNLTTLDGIYSLPELQELNLSMTSVKEISDSIKFLSSLIFLDLSKSKIIELPASLFSLKNIKVLRFNNTLVSNLPNIRFEMRNLEELWLANTRIKVVPEDFLLSPKIKVLWASWSRIKDGIKIKESLFKKNVFTGCKTSW